MAAEKKKINYSDQRYMVPPLPEWWHRQPIKKYRMEINYLRDQYRRALEALKAAGLEMNIPEDLVGGINNLAQIASIYRDMYEELKRK